MPISRLRPLDVKILFDDRPYKLGETINVMLELSARSEIEVREARVDLVCEEYYVESYDIMVPDIKTGRSMGGLYGGSGIATGYTPTPMIPKQVTKEHRETYIHSSVIFLADSLLNSGVTDQYDVRLGIETELPPHAGISVVKWRLELVVDVARARDVKTRHKVDVELPGGFRRGN